MYVHDLALCVAQVEANNQLKGVVAEGADVLPAQVIEDAFQNQYDKTLNYSDFKQAIQKLDGWYKDRGIFGQVASSACIHIHTFYGRMFWLLRKCCSCSTIAWARMEARADVTGLQPSAERGWLVPSHAM